MSQSKRRINWYRAALGIMALLTIMTPFAGHAEGPQTTGSSWTYVMYYPFSGDSFSDKWHFYGDPTWGTTDHRVFEGSESLWCARSGSQGRDPAVSEYANNMNAWAAYGPFDLSDALEAEWIFRRWISSESGRDTLTWGASVDGANYRYWDADVVSGQHEVWQKEVFDLSNVYEYGNLCGRPQVWVALWFQSNGSVTGAGAFIDLMRIRKLVPDLTERCHLPLVARQLRVSEPLASRLIHSSEEGTVEHPSGASIYVPEGAVPPKSDGSEGEMLFTIERGGPTDMGVSTSMPDPAMGSVGNVYYMTPEGFTLVKPVRVTLPLPAGFDTESNQVSILEWDAAAESWVNRGGITNSEGTAVYADMMHLSTVWLVSDPDRYKAKGALTMWRQRNRSFTCCISGYDLKYPEKDGELFYASNYSHRVSAHNDDPVLMGDTQWLLPQGSYTIQIEVWEKPQGSGWQPEVSLGYFERNVSISNPVQWSQSSGGYDRGTTTPVDLVGSALTPGRPGCVGTPSASVGIGPLNFRLEWNLRCDLDLWVVDPCGNRIFWGDDRQTCGSGTGQLDLDNKCSNLVLGRPENIFWQGTPAPGQYRVYVDPYENCGARPAASFTLRTWVRGQATTSRGQVNLPATRNQPDDQILVKTIQY